MFLKARLKLTVWYLLIIMLVSLTFSVIIYRNLSFEVERFERIQRFRIERRLLDKQDYYSSRSLPVPMANPELIEETKKRILWMLIVLNSTIIIFAGGIGYLLAGRTLQPIKEMMDEQNRFITDASHELRTPLTSLKSAMEVFLRGKKPSLSEAIKLVEESINDVNRLQSLSESLLELSQYQKPDNHLKLEQISLSQVISEAIRKLEPLAKKKKVEIKCELQETLLRGNVNSMTDLLVILLDNAIKYSPSRSLVMIKSKKVDKSVLISVKDQGIGIERGELPHIFERFYRTDHARSMENGGGYGLGLAIAQKIVNIHQGSIEIESTPKKGSEFIIRLPVNRSLI